MNLYSIPVGAFLVLWDRELTEREVHPATPVRIGDIEYTVSVFSAMSQEDLAALGIKSFVEDAIPDGYTGGVPVDIETDYEIHRTYPNPVPIPPAPLDPLVQRAAITEAERADTLSDLKERIEAMDDSAQKFALLEILTVIEGDSQNG